MQRRVANGMAGIYFASEYSLGLQNIQSFSTHLICLIEMFGNLSHKTVKM